MLKYYWGVLRAAASLHVSRVDLALNLLFILAIILFLFNQEVADKVLSMSGFDRRWAVLPLALLFAYTLLRVNYANVASLTGERDQAQAALAAIPGTASRPRVPSAEVHISPYDESRAAFLTDGGNHARPDGGRWTKLDLLVHSTRNVTLEGVVLEIAGGQARTTWQPNQIGIVPSRWTIWGEVPATVTDGRHTVRVVAHDAEDEWWGSQPFAHVIEPT